MPSAYRISLTLQELQQLAATPELSSSLRLKLQKELLKASAGLKSPSHTARASLEEKLGMETSLTKEQLWERCYQKQQQTPNLCSLLELAQANEWAYLNGLLSPADTLAFENGQIPSLTSPFTGE